MIYVVVLLYIFFLIIRFDYHKAEEGRDQHYFFLLLIFIFVSGLSYRLGIDVVRYQGLFESGEYSLNDFNLFDFGERQTATEPGWVFVNAVVYNLTHNWVIFKLLLAAFFNGVVFWFFKKHSPAPFTAVFIYAIMGFFQINFQVLRESISIAFFIIALDKLMGEHPSYLKYYLWAIPAIFFHRFGWVVLIFPIFSFLRLNKTFVLILICSSLLLPIVLNYFNLARLFLLSSDLSDSMGSYLTSESWNEVRRGNFFGFISSVLFFAPLVIFSFAGNDESVKKFVGFSMMYMFLYILNTSTFAFFYRINNYIQFPMAVVVSNGMSALLYSEDRTDVNVWQCFKIKPLMILLISCFLIIRTKDLTHGFISKMYIPYSSVITKKTDSEREAIYRTIGI